MWRWPIRAGLRVNDVCLHQSEFDQMAFNCHITNIAYQYQTEATTLFLGMYLLELQKNIQYIELNNKC